MGEPVMTPREVADALRVGVGTLARWRGNHTGPSFVRMGGLIRYRASAVEAWMRSNTDT